MVGVQRKGVRCLKRSDMGRCFYIVKPNNPTKDTSGLHNSIVVKTRNRKGESLREG